MHRRQFLQLLGSGVVFATLPACAKAATSLGPGDPRVAAVEAARKGTRLVEQALSAQIVPVDLAGRIVNTWAYGSGPAAAPIRVRKGERLKVNLTNALPEATTIHWHGLALRNDMDGVPDMTQPKVQPGTRFTYEFTVANAGTYFFHPHMGPQLDRGLYSPLIVEDPDEPSAPDAEHVLVLDDWLDGIDGATPESTLEGLKTKMSRGMEGMAGMNHGGGSGGTGMATSTLLRGDAGDVAYPLHLINGKPPADRPTFMSPVGGRTRLRVINAGSDTAYRFAVGGHRLTVTHSDGFPVLPFDVDTILIGMGERYDVTVSPQSGAWPIVASAEGKNATAVGVLRTTDAAASAAPQSDASLPELDREVLRYADLKPHASVALQNRPVDKTIKLRLTGDMMSYNWSLNDKRFPDTDKLIAREGQRVRIEMTNESMMWHPMHLHGHTFALDGNGLRKDTINVLPGETQAIILDADNPGQWMMHCHNTYHLEQGMATTLSYAK